MKRSGLVLLVVLFSATIVSAQFRNNYNPRPRQSNNSSTDAPRKVYFGGGGGFGLGTGYNYYSVFPMVGYRVTDDFSVGTGAIYTRYNYNYTYSYSFTQYGVSPFLRYNFNPLFIQTELDFISAPTINANGEQVRDTYNRLLFGLGYTSSIGKRSAVNVLAMYDVLYKQPSPFNSPLVFRVFVTF